MYINEEEIVNHISAKPFHLISEAAEELGVEVYVIGGYVRDIFLNRPSKDIDVVAVGSGIELAKRVAKKIGRGAYLSVFKNFGTAQVKAGDLELEFVGARKESYSHDSRKPVVEDGTLEDDQNRRDFTINALALCLNKERYGELVDPFGGLEDMDELTIRTPLDPDVTFSDDPLRMMRAVRFATQLGFFIDPDTFDAIIRNRERISIISKERIVDELNKSGVLPFEVVWKPTLITNELIRRTFNEANTDEECAGVITWMHTFSPAKSWILGLQEYRKPLLHLHTQFNEELPYDTIDMDFMNENQSAHGDREYGHIVSRMGIERKVVVGHWADRQVQERIASWMRTAVGVVESSHIRVMRVADNMRNVAVTEGDKVEAQIKFGWEVDAYPVNEIAESVAAVSASDTNALVDEYYDKYEILLEGRDPGEFKRHVAVQAQIELGFERFLQEKNYQAIVTHFGDLGALKQLPGLAIQRLMEKGYGFGAEGDWKVAAMVRLMKVMTAGMKDAKGTSMLEDYTYNFVKGKEGILEAHMLEICPSIADGPISIKCQPLTMGDREDPARLVFTSKEGKGIATSLIDLGNRFRLIINDVDCKKTEKPMPKLPVATNFWTPQPDLYTGAEAWILAGGAHHTAFTYDLTAEQMGDWAAAMGIEAVYIDKDTNIRDFKKDLMLGDIVYR